MNRSQKIDLGHHFYFSLTLTSLFVINAPQVFPQNVYLLQIPFFFSSTKHRQKLSLTSSVPTRYSFCRAFLSTLNELNDYAGQHEVIAENLTSQIITELSRYLQELKSERKSVRLAWLPFTISDK